MATDNEPQVTDEMQAERKPLVNKEMLDNILSDESKILTSVAGTMNQLLVLLVALAQDLRAAREKDK